MTATLEHRAVLRHRQVLAAATAARSRTISLHWVTVTLMMGLLAAVWAGDRFTFWFVQQLPFSWMFAIGPGRKSYDHMTKTDQTHVDDRADHKTGDNSDYVSDHRFSFEVRDAWI